MEELWGLLCWPSCSLFLYTSNSRRESIGHVEEGTIKNGMIGLKPSLWRCLGNHWLSGFITLCASTLSPSFLISHGSSEFYILWLVSIWEILGGSWKRSFSWMLISFQRQDFILFYFYLFIYFLVNLKKKLFIYLAAPGLNCSTRDLCCSMQDLLVATCGIFTVACGIFLVVACGLLVAAYGI